MNKRQWKIIRLLNEQNAWITANELSKLFGVSDRTIRSDIEAINQETDIPLIASNLRKGYSLLKENYQSYCSLTAADTLPQEPNQRNTYILKRLLLSRDAVSITDLLSELYISEYSLDTHIKKIRKSLHSYKNLELKKTKNTLCLIGSEQEIRQLYKELMVEETQQNFLNINEIASLYQNFDLIKCKHELENILNQYQYKVNPISFPSIILHIGISIDRILNGKYAETIRDSSTVKDTTEYQIAKKFYEKISLLYQASIQESEIFLLALLLMGKTGAHFTDEQIAQYIPDGATCSQIVDELINYIDIHHGINFSNDENLKIGLTIHLQAMIERNIKQHTAANLYLQEIKRKFPLIFEVGVSCATFLERRLCMSVTEDEIGFVALHLGMAYERLNTANKIRTVLIMPLANTVGSSPVQKIEYTFAEYIEIIGVYSYFQEDIILQLNPDLIVCSMPLRHTLDIPTAEVSIFLSRDDESKLFNTIYQIERDRFKRHFSHKLKMLLRKKHFYVHQNFSNAEEVIRYIADDLYRANAVTADFFDSVMRRESFSPTSFSYSFATPHPIDSTVLQSNIAVMILDKPIRWGNYDVQIVFLLAMEQLDNEALKPFYDWIAMLTDDYEKLSRLIASENYEAFIANLI